MPPTPPPPKLLISRLDELLHELLRPALIALPGLPLAVAPHALHQALLHPEQVRLTLYEAPQTSGQDIPWSREARVDGRVAFLTRVRKGLLLQVEGHPPTTLARLDDSALRRVLQEASGRAEAAFTTWLHGLSGEHHELRPSLPARALRDFVAALVSADPELLTAFQPPARSQPDRLRWSQANACYVLVARVQERVFVAAAPTLHALQPHLFTLHLARTVNSTLARTVNPE